MRDAAERSREAAEMRDAAEVQPRWCRDAVEMQPRTAEISGLTSAELPQIPQLININEWAHLGRAASDPTAN